MDPHDSDQSGSGRFSAQDLGSPIGSKLSLSLRYLHHLKINGPSRCRPDNILSENETHLGQYRPPRASLRSSQVSHFHLVRRPCSHETWVVATILSRSSLTQQKEQSMSRAAPAGGLAQKAMEADFQRRVWDPEGKEYIDMLSAYS